MNSQAKFSGRRRGSAAFVLVAALILIRGNLALAGPGQPGAGVEAAPAASAAHVAAGENHTCAVTTGGAVLCWGWNTEGQLGDGSRAERFSPVSVQGLPGPASAVAAGEGHSCALMRNGTVSCWGGNHAGQLGDGTTTGRLSPVGVRGLAGAVAIAAGRDHTCALTSAGGAKCWGANDYGQLGNASLKNSLVPADVSGLAAGATRVSAGSQHTCAAMNEASGGGVRCWGRNLWGALGDGTTFDRVTPVQVTALSGVMRSIAAGGGHSCAVTAAGAAKCWGLNDSGQLGNGELGNGATGNQTAPVDVTGLASGVASVAAGSRATCAASEAGAVLCWGMNPDGDLFPVDRRSFLTPRPVTGLSSDAQMLAAGAEHTCALMSGGALKCWGLDLMGQLGTGTGGGRYPVDVGPFEGGVRAADAGEFHTCAVTAAGGVKCWGSNQFGQLGDGTIVTRYKPLDVMGLTSGMTAVAVGDRHSCALSAEGGVECWGGHSPEGAVYGTTTPVQLVGFEDRVVALALGSETGCALTAAGGVMCWGLYGSCWAPVDLYGFTSGVTAIAVGARHICALTTAGGVKCRGNNEFGQLGDATGQWSESPRDVYGLTSGVTAIAAGGDHTCAVLQAGTVKCWGRNNYGQVGNGTMLNAYSPKYVTALESVVAVGAGSFHTCALTTSGVKCWGSNQSGQLGDGSFDDRSTPVAAHGLASGVVSVMGGGYYSTDYWNYGHSCALAQGGDTLGLKCWGNNSYGQLGDGAGREPVTVVGFEGDPITPSPTPTEAPSPTTTPAAGPPLWLPVIYG